MSRPADPLTTPRAPARQVLPPEARPLSPHAGDGARPSTAAQERARRRRTRKRSALLAGTGALLAGVIGFAASATALPTGESWGAELAVSGGDDTNVRLVDGAVRLVTPSTDTARSEGVMLLAPRRPAVPTNAVTTELTADLPPGTAARVDVRGILPDGAWSPWFPTRDDVRTVLPAMTTQVQARIVMQGGSGAVSPAVQRLWLTTASTTATPAATTAPAPTTTTAPTTTPALPTTTASTTTKPSGGTTPTTTVIPIKPSTPPKPPTPAPAAAGRIWTADVTRQGLGMFKDTPWNLVGAKKPTVVDATGLPGRKALRFTMPGGATRAEIEPNVDNLTEGQDRFVRMSVRLADGFPVNTNTWQLITQFKNEGTGSPPLELRIGNGNFVLSGGFGRPGGSRSFDKVIGPAVTGRTVTVVLRVKFSSDPSKGVVDAWLDGQQRFAGFKPPGGTLYPGMYSYWKLGLYRDSGIGTPATYELSDAMLGSSYASVTTG